MKLKIVKARIGLQWVRLGMRTFFRKPLAMAGLFFLYMAMISVATLIPVIGTLIALGLLPAATLGLMAASQEADRGKFPMPSILVSAFRAGKQEMRAMLTLGALYAAGFLIVLAISSLFDGGQFAMLYLMGGEMTRELAQTPDFRTAMLVALALYLPLSLMFWHAPALVHWHGVPPVKSLFFSFIACWKNFGAYTLYGIGWVGRLRRLDHRHFAFCGAHEQRNIRGLCNVPAGTADGGDVLHLDLFHIPRQLRLHPGHPRRAG